MAYKFQFGPAVMSGSLDQEGALDIIGNEADSAELKLGGTTVVDSNRDVFGRILSASSEIRIGAAQITQAELETIDGVTAGTVAASKAVVVDSDKDVSGFRNVTGTGNITAGGSFIIGSADLDETDMEKLDGITNGTAAANKAMVLGANLNIGLLNSLSASTVTCDTALVVGSTSISETEAGFIDGVTAGVAAGSKAMVLDANKDIAGHRNLSGSGVLENVGNVRFGGALDVTGNLGVVGSVVNFANIGTAALPAGEFFVTRNDTGDLKVRTRTNIASDFAGAGMTAASGELNMVAAANGGLTVNADSVELDVNQLSAVTAIASGDTFAMAQEAEAGDPTKKVTIDSLATKLAGAGLMATDGVLSLESSEVTVIHDGATLSEGYNFATGSAGATVSLPDDSQVAGDVVTIKNGAAGTLTILTSGSHKIDDADSIVLESAGAAVTCVYLATNIWGIV
tara:strand:+ start:8392 stop:9759 length:1368 start_codon:yes stop_codon:yes gene_type:complete